MIKFKGKIRPLVIYGYGRLGHLTEEVFTRAGVTIDGIFDNNPELRNPPFPHRFSQKMKKECVLVVCVATQPSGILYDELRKKGWRYPINVYDVFEKNPQYGMTSGWKHGGHGGRGIEKDRRNVMWVSRSLHDKISQYHWQSFVVWHRHRRERGIGIIERTFWKAPDFPSTLKDIEERRKVIIYPDEPMDSVSIHAEGCELETIKYNISLFKKYRPKIEISVYHTMDGLWKIEKRLMEELDNYRWEFRVYAFQGQAAYLYGTPKEKIDDMSVE